MALGALALVTLIWGGSFTWMKSSLDSGVAVLGAGRELQGTALFLLVRFAAAGLLMLAIPRARAIGNRSAWQGGFILGALLFAGFVLQMVGLVDVSPAVSAFLTSLYVLFTALIVTFHERRKLSWILVVGAASATLGAALIRGAPQMLLSLGELLTVGAALMFGIHILATDRITRRVDPLAVTTTSFFTVAAACAVLLLGYQLLGQPISSTELQQLCTHPGWWFPLLMMTLLGTVVALTFMNLFQKEVDPVRAAILYSSEPVWAAIIGIWAGYDQWSGWLLLGGGLLLGGNLFVELGPRWLARR